MGFWNPEIGKEINKVQAHDKAIHDVQFAKDFSCFITASLDHTAKLFDTETGKCLKTYQSNAPVNAVAINTMKNHIILGGGQDAGSVTTTDARMGKFETKWYHKIYQDDLCNGLRRWLCSHPPLAQRLRRGGGHLIETL